MPTFHELLIGLGPTVLTAVGCFLVLLFLVNRRRWTKVHRRRRSRPSEPEGVLPYALSLGFLVGYIALDTDHKIPYRSLEPMHWLFWGAAGMFVLCLANHFIRIGRWAWFAVSMSLVGLTFCAIVTMLPDAVWTGEEKLYWWCGSWAAALVVDLALDQCFRREGGWSAGAAMAIVSVAISLVLAMSGAKTYGLLAALLPAVLVPVLILTALFRTPLFTSAAVPLFVLLSGGFLLCGYLFTELKAVDGAVLFLAPLGLLVRYVPAVGRLKSWQQGAIEFFCVAAPAAIVFGTVLHKFLVDMEQYSSSY